MMMVGSDSVPGKLGNCIRRPFLESQPGGRKNTYLPPFVTWKNLPLFYSVVDCCIVVAACLNSLAIFCRYLLPVLECSGNYSVPSHRCLPHPALPLPPPLPSPPPCLPFWEVTLLPALPPYFPVVEGFSILLCLVSLFPLVSTLSLFCLCMPFLPCLYSLLETFLLPAQSLFLFSTTCMITTYHHLLHTVFNLLPSRYAILPPHFVYSHHSLPTYGRKEGMPCLLCCCIPDLHSAFIMPTHWEVPNILPVLECLFPLFPSWVEEYSGNFCYREEFLFTCSFSDGKEGACVPHFCYAYFIPYSIYICITFYYYFCPTLLLLPACLALGMPLFCYCYWCLLHSPQFFPSHSMVPFCPTPGLYLPPLFGIYSGGRWIVGDCVSLFHLFFITFFIQEENCTCLEEGRILPICLEGSVLHIPTYLLA